MSWKARARPKRSSGCSPIATPPTFTCTTPSAAATPRASNAPDGSSLRRQGPSGPSEATRCFGRWIPAYAGMTIRRLVEPGGEHVAARAPLVLAARGRRANEVDAVAADLRVLDEVGHGRRRNRERIELAGRRGGRAGRRATA